MQMINHQLESAVHMGRPRAEIVKIRTDANSIKISHFHGSRLGSLLSAYSMQLNSGSRRNVVVESPKPV